MSELAHALELVHGAADRITTLATTLVVWLDEERWLGAIEALRQREPRAGVIVFRHPGSEHAQPRRYEQRTVVQYRAPDRYRQVQVANLYAHRPHDLLQVCDGEHEWTYTGPDGEAYVQPAEGQSDIANMVDPSWLAATCRLDVAGPTSYEGRPAIQLVGRPRSTPQTQVRHMFVGAGEADELHALIDAETGLLLSLASHFGGSPYRVQRLTELVLDEPLDDALFRFDPPPGVPVREADEPGRRVPLRFRLRRWLLRRSYRLPS